MDGTAGTAEERIVAPITVGVCNSLLTISANAATVDGTVEGIVGATEKLIVVRIYPPAASNHGGVIE